MLVTFVVGVVFPFIWNPVKNWFNLEGKAALWGTFVIAVLLGAGVEFAGCAGLGDVCNLDLAAMNPESLVANVGVIFAMALLLYRQFIAGK